MHDPLRDLFGGTDGIREGQTCLPRVIDRRLLLEMHFCMQTTRS